MLESGLLADAGDRYELSGPLPPLAIPTTLHDSLMARLDRLAPVKEVAQIGAVIGREFSHELLAAVSPLSANRAGRRPRPAGQLRAGLPPRHAARRDLQLQARAGPGCRLPIVAQEPAPAAARSHRSRPGGALPGDGRNAAGTAGASLYGSSANRTCRRLLAEGGRACRRPLGQSRSDPAPYPGVGGARNAPGKPRTGSPRARVSDRDRHAPDRRAGLLRSADGRRLQSGTRPLRAAGRGAASRSQLSAASSCITLCAATIPSCGD